MPSSAQNITRFGNFYRSGLLKDSRLEVSSLLNQDEISFIESLRISSDADTAYLHHLNGNINEFFEVRQHIMALLQVWDAIIDEKNRHDAGGRPRQTKFFMKAFLVCMKLVPGRVNIGSLGLDSQDSIHGLFQDDRTPMPSQFENSPSEASPTNEGLEGAEPLRTGSSGSDMFFTSSDDDGYETSSYFSDVSGLHIDLQYNESQGQDGYPHDLVSCDLNDFLIGENDEGEESASGHNDIEAGTQFMPSGQTISKKRRHAEAWDEDQSKPKTRRRLN